MYSNKLDKNKILLPYSPVHSKQSQGQSTLKFTDNRPEAVAQRKLYGMTHKPALEESPIQKKNNTGLPNTLKAGIENLFGYAMEDVKVHYNSNKPAQLQAHAYAQGTNIHLGAGQEKHLSHEAWHVVQQKQGRVQPTFKAKGHIAINDYAGL